MSLTCLKADKRAVAYRDWNGWLEQSSKLHDRFLDEIGISPFDANEQSSVGLFAAASAMAGHLPLLEYGIRKKDRDDRRKRCNGRADLWIDFPARCYSFEFKRAWYAATLKNLRATLTVVRGDIGCVGDEEHDVAAACMIAYVRDAHRKHTYEAFAEDKQVHFAYHIGPADAGGAYLYFALKD